jgi:hypothetical protein
VGVRDGNPLGGELQAELVGLCREQGKWKKVVLLAKRSVNYPEPDVGFDGDTTRNL